MSSLLTAVIVLLISSLAQHTLAFVSIAPKRRTVFSHTHTRLLLATTMTTTSSTEDVSPDRYTIPDQPARFARAKAQQNQRYLDITSVYDPQYLKGKRVAITGANRGIGLALAQELVAQGGRLVAIGRSSSPQLEALQPEESILNIDVTSDEDCSTVASQIKGGPIDILINNAGYFYEPVEKMDSLNFKEELKMIDICALGPLRITANLFNHGLLKSGASSVVMITSQGGSIAWRTTQNPKGGDYGHHMSKAAANMMAVLLSQEFKDKQIPVLILHPGFNKTEMTAKYQKIWEIEGAVDASVGAKRVFHEIGKISMEITGKFINCEDGLEIPW